MSLPSNCVLFRAAYPSLIGRVARYALSSDFGMHLRNSAQFEVQSLNTYLMFTVWIWFGKDRAASLNQSGDAPEKWKL